MAFDIVGERFDRSGFEGYVNGVSFKNWTPSKVVLHNTSSPSLALRPNGFTKVHMGYLRDYYVGKGWKGGPHLFVDQNGIWVFNPLTKRGTHSPSWNSNSWGVEMLGEYESDSFTSGHGALVRDNTVSAVAKLFRKLGSGPDTPGAFNLHKEDPKTSHKSCPGKHVNKADLVKRVKEAMAGPSPTPSAKLVLFRKGFGHEPFAVLSIELRQDGRAYADSALLSQETGISATTQGMVAIKDYLAGKYRVTWDSATSRAYAVEL